MYSVIDIESNGAGFRQESIIDIAVFRFDGHEVTDQFISLVNPEADITPFVQKLTGITPKMVKTAPKFHEIAKRLVEITEGTTLVGHNIEFDYRLLRQSFKRLGYDFKIDTLDTIPLAKKLIPEAESYSLGKLVKSLGIPLIKPHRADADARATVDLFKLLLAKDTDNEIIRQQHDDTNAKTYVNKIKALTQDLPSERGLLYFQDAQGQILYSDYVDDFNKFAKKVFNAKSKRWAEIQQHTEQLHYEPAAHRLLARLLMKTKGLDKRETLPFGLYHRSGKYLVEKNTLHKDDKPLLKFRSFTQGLKVLQYLNQTPELQNPEALRQKISLKKRNEIWTISGRTLGEKVFLVIENGKANAYGFYEFYPQIESPEKINKLKIKLPASTADLQNEMQLTLLKGELRISPLPPSAR
ncbi:3'-5' exonuclease [Bergeyella sp. RCAD1439]|uniref:3'-5' exonuclease n=1 Tax=Bergeyella anatis TaxID=3113737 RepID=UPI002E184758|nr:3'-5' exonuclease [Bergeyella sp. RCAD1439]